jgi:hypothetical protein
MLGKMLVEVLHRPGTRGFFNLLNLFEKRHPHGQALPSGHETPSALTIYDPALTHTQWGLAKWGSWWHDAATPERGMPFIGLVE